MSLDQRTDDRNERQDAWKVSSILQASTDSLLRPQPFQICNDHFPAKQRASVKMSKDEKVERWKGLNVYCPK